MNLRGHQDNDWLSLIEGRIDAAGARKARNEASEEYQMSARSYYLTEYYSTLLATLIEDLDANAIGQWAENIGSRAIDRFKSVTETSVDQKGNKDAFDIRPFCRLYGGAVRRTEADRRQLQSRLPLIIQRAEAVLKKKKPSYYDQIYVVGGQLLSNFIINKGVGDIRELLDTISTAISSEEDVKCMIWPTISPNTSILIEASAEILAYRSPARAKNHLREMWKEYRRITNNETRICRAVERTSDMHFFYSLILLRTAWYKIPKMIDSNWWSWIEQELQDYGGYDYQFETSDVPLLNAASSVPVPKVYAISYRMLTFMFSPNQQNIKWIEHIEWRIYQYSGDDGTSTAISNAFVQLFGQPPALYMMPWATTLRMRMNNINRESAGRGYILLLDALPTDSLSRKECQLLVQSVATESVFEAIYAYAEDREERKLTTSVLNTILKDYGQKRHTSYLRDQLRTVAQDIK